MAELTAKTPCEGLLPLEIGSVSLMEVTPEHLTSLAPASGHEAAMSDALKAAHGMAFPANNRTSGKAGSKAVWFGQGVAMLIGPKPDASLASHGAVTDQSDAWAVVQLEGDDAADVLARLTPVDLRPGSFKRGHTARTQLIHMMSSITRTGDRSFQIMVFRSMAQTLVHDLKSAMETVAAVRRA